MAPFERRCATFGTPEVTALGSVLVSAADGIQRVITLREARSHRQDLSRAQWEHLVLLVYPSMMERERQAVPALLGALEAVRPRAGVAPFGTVLTARRIVDGLVLWRGEWPPTQDDFAERALGVTARWVRQVLRDGITDWKAVIEEAESRRQLS